MTEEKQFQCDFLIEAYIFRVKQNVLGFFDGEQRVKLTKSWAIEVENKQNPPLMVKV